MKKLGYIYRYSKTEQTGILVYGNGILGQPDYVAPILFYYDQCRNVIETGQLVYFDIEDDGSVKNIETASIYNFDRELVLNYVSEYGSKDWHECEKNAHICYQNIAELREWVPKENKTSCIESSKDKNDSDSAEVDTRTDESLDLLEEDIENIFNSIFDDFDYGINYGKGYYRKVIIPKSIKEEFMLFGRPFPRRKYTSFDNRSNDKDLYIKLDVLDPTLWIPTKAQVGMKYYGYNANEFKDLIDLLIIRRRNAQTHYLNDIRYKGNNNLFQFDLKIQKYLRPDLFPNDCVSNRWLILLEKLSDTDLMEVYQYCKLLQPVLPTHFCESHIDILSEDYGFPDANIAEAFLRSKIRNIRTATEYKHCMNLLQTANNCGVKHLPEEGVPLCAIDKVKIKNLSISLGRKMNSILSFIKKQIRINNPNMEFSNIAGVLDIMDNKLILGIGEFYDFITAISDDLYLIYSGCEGIVESYDNLPKEVHILFDSYLHNELNKLLLEAIKSGELSPFCVHSTLEKLSRWVDNSFVIKHANVIKNTFIKNNDVSDLIYALKYGYISKCDFHERYVELANERTDNECLNDLHDCSNYRFPERTQMYILERILTNYGLEFSYSYGNKNYEFPGYVRVHSLNDFLSWINDNTVKYGHGCISKEVAESIQNRVSLSLTNEQCWFLFEKDIIYVLSPECIRDCLNEAYSKYRFEDKCFEKDCFQVKMADDVMSSGDIRLVKAIIDKLNPKYRNIIDGKIKGVGELYLWSINPTSNINWNLLCEHLVNLDSNTQKRIFRFLFLYQSKYKEYTNIDFLNRLIKVLESNISIYKEKERLSEQDLFDSYYSNKSTLSALLGMVSIIKEKVLNPCSPIIWRKLWSIIAVICPHRVSFLREIKDFFEECTGWLLISSYHSRSIEYYSRNGYVQRVQRNDSNESYYIVRFYGTPLDINGRPVDYLDYSDIEKVENALKRNFTYQYVDGAYLINQKDEIRLKEFITTYKIDDNCNLFNDIFDHNQNQGYGIPEHLNFPTKYEDNHLFICNCSQYKSVDPKYGIPYCWCKKHPCTRKFFLHSDQDWNKFKFVDLLWIILNDTLDISEIWEINSEIASFINTIVKNHRNKDLQLSSSPLSSNAEVGTWTCDMCIYTEKSCDDYSYPDDEHDEVESHDDNRYSSDEDTYERYNGSWAQDVEGYSDDDIDTIFDGDPDAYWNID